MTTVYTGHGDDDSLLFVTDEEGGEFQLPRSVEPVAAQLIASARASPDEIPLVPALCAAGVLPLRYAFFPMEVGFLLKTDCDFIASLARPRGPKTWDLPVSGTASDLDAVSCAFLISGYSREIVPRPHHYASESLFERLIEKGGLDQSVGVLPRYIERLSPKGWRQIIRAMQLSACELFGGDLPSWFSQRGPTDDTW